MPARPRPSARTAPRQYSPIVTPLQFALGLACGSVLLSASPAMAACTPSGDVFSFNCSAPNLQMQGDNGSSSLTLTDVTADSVLVTPAVSATGPVNQTLILDGHTVLNRSDYSAVIVQPIVPIDGWTDSWNANVTIGSDVTITSGGGSGAVFLRSDSANPAVHNNLSVDSSGQVTANTGDGITASSNNGGVTVINRGTAISADGRGLYADGGYYSPSTSPVTVNIENSGTVQGYVDAVRSINYQGTASASNSGTITSTTRRGIVAWSNNGDAQATNSGYISSGNDDGVVVETENGNATMVNSGSIVANKNTAYTAIGLGFAGIRTYADTSGSVMVTNEAGGHVTANYGEGIAAYTPQGDVTVTNAGRIDALSGVYANADDGTIQISNSGQIIGATDGIRVLNANGGTILNSGTIQAPTALNIASDSIGAVTNSGLIAGTLFNGGTRDLSIAGGSSGTGTLTGASGGTSAADKGTITSTGANVLFTGGDLLLNDDINVAGHAVINSGANLHISNAIAVTGNYTQIGGGLVFQAASPASYGRLDVSGTASVSNSSISLSGPALDAGQSYTLVSAGTAGAYSGNTAFFSVNAGLLARMSQIGNDLVVTISPDGQHHYWDGANTSADGTIAGGSGTWTATGTNWTNTDGTGNGTLDTADVRPVFGGTAGTVTVDDSQGAIKVSGMQFSTDGYRVTGDAIGLTAAASAFEVDDNVNATIDSALQGTGGLAKTGNGMLVLNGVNTYTGGTSVSAGTLEIGDADHAGASILGDVAVGSAGTLRGHGTIGGSVTNNGVVRPGGSIGTLTIAGNYTQSPSGTLFVDVSPTEASQLKVAGTATLGGTLNVLYGPGTYSAASYRIIDASTVTGQFSSVTSNAPANLAESVQKLADGSTLTLSGSDTVVVKPTNATIFGALGSAAIREGQRVNETLLSRLGQACADAASAADCARPGRQAWAQIVSDTAHVHGNDEAPSYKDSHYGFLTGLDHQVGPWTLGIAGGYSHIDVSEDDASGKIDTVRVAGYGSRRLGPVDVAATVGAAYDFLQSRRSFAGLGSAKGDTDGQEITAGLQASLPLATGRFTITPRVGLRYQYFHADSFGESGSTSQNLHVGSQDINSLQPYAQLAVGLPFTTGAARPALVEARVGYAYETLDASRTVAAAASDGTRFTLPGVAPSRGMLTAGVGLTLPLGKAVDITASYDRLFDTGNVSAQAFQLKGSYRF